MKKAWLWAALLGGVCRFRRRIRLTSISRRALHVEDLTRLRWRGDVVAEHLDDLGCLLDQRRVAGRELALLKIEVVLKPNAHVTAEQHGLGYHRKLVERNPECEPG